MRWLASLPVAIVADKPGTLASIETSLSGIRGRFLHRVAAHRLDQPARHLAGI